MTTYTGHVEPGGTPGVHELAALIVTKTSVGPTDNNVYVLRCRRTDEQVVIDAAAEPHRVLDVIGDGPVRAVITTHRHQDHWRALEQVTMATRAITVAHVDDAPGIGVAIDRIVVDGDLIEFGDCVLRVVHLVGHTPGGIALVYDDPTGAPHVFTGDSLFPGGVGKTTSPENFAALLGAVEAKLFDALPDETWVYPGHGDDTTLGAERPHLAEWRARGW